MKKHYLGFGIIYCVLALAVFLTAISFYTKKKIDKLNEFAGYSVINTSSFFPETFHDPRSIVKRTLQSWQFTGYQIEEEGFYSSVIDTRDNFNVLVESEDLLMVRYYGEIEAETKETAEGYETKYIQLAPGDDRYILFDRSLSLSTDEKLDLEFPKDVTITGAMCDDIFVYGGSLTFSSNGTTKTIEIPRPSAVDVSGSVPYEDWIVRLDSIEYYPLSVNSGDGRLNGKAHKLSDAHLEKFINGEASSYLEIKKGIFTSTASVIFVYDGGNYLVTMFSVMYPLQTVIKQNIMIYILFLLALILIEAVIIFAVRKLYLNQKSFELRSRKLTKSIAHDLKEPLATAKAHMENWEELGEEERQKNSEKIISEVDHMANMVTKLLELSKTNGSSIKLNKAETDLLSLTQKVKNKYQEVILRKNINVSIISGEGTDGYPVYADPEMMYLVINGFMSNAVKYCDHTVNVKLENTGNSVWFSITNDGARIDKNDLDKIWNARLISNEETADPDENGGIDLCVVKNILEAHHAKYYCYNGSKGATFVFSMEASASDPSLTGEDNI